MEDYYNNTEKKVIDFLIGFFGLIIIGFLINILIFFLLSTTILVEDSLFDYMYLISLLFQFLIVILIIIFLFIKKRKYIAIGMISVTLIPLLIFFALFIYYLFIELSHI